MERRPPSPDEEDDDVIILSDNDSPSPPMNGLNHLKELDADLLMVRYCAFHAVDTLSTVEVTSDPTDLTAPSRVCGRDMDPPDDPIERDSKRMRDEGCMTGPGAGLFVFSRAIVVSD